MERGELHEKQMEPHKPTVERRSSAFRHTNQVTRGDATKQCLAVDTMRQDKIEHNSLDVENDDEVKPLSAQEKYKEFQMALVTLEKSIKDLNIGEQDRRISETQTTLDRFYAQFADIAQQICAVIQEQGNFVPDDRQGLTHFRHKHYLRELTTKAATLSSTLVTLIGALNTNIEASNSTKVLDVIVKIPGQQTIVSTEDGDVAGTEAVPHTTCQSTEQLANNTSAKDQTSTDALSECVSECSTWTLTPDIENEGEGDWRDEYVNEWCNINCANKPNKSEPQREHTVDIKREQEHKLKCFSDRTADKISDCVHKMDPSNVERLSEQLRNSFQSTIGIHKNYTKEPKLFVPDLTVNGVPRYMFKKKFVKPLKGHLLNKLEQESEHSTERVDYNIEPDRPTKHAHVNVSPIKVESEIKALNIVNFEGHGFLPSGPSKYCNALKPPKPLPVMRPIKNYITKERDASTSRKRSVDDRQRVKRNNVRLDKLEDIGNNLNCMCISNGRSNMKQEGIKTQDPLLFSEAVPTGITYWMNQLESKGSGITDTRDYTNAADPNNKKLAHSKRRSDIRIPLSMSELDDIITRRKEAAVSDIRQEDNYNTECMTEDVCGIIKDEPRAIKVKGSTLLVRSNPLGTAKSPQRMSRWAASHIAHTRKKRMLASPLPSWYQTVDNYVIYPTVTSPQSYIERFYSSPPIASPCEDQLNNETRESPEPQGQD